MTDGSLTPTLALAYLRELSLDVRSAVVLDAAGERLAGDPELVEHARTALATHLPRAGGGQIVRGDHQTLVLARAENGVAIAISAGPHALLELLLHDVEASLRELA